MLRQDMLRDFGLMRIEITNIFLIPWMILKTLILERKMVYKENKLYLLQNENGNTDRIYSDNEIVLELGILKKMMRI